MHDLSPLQCDGCTACCENRKSQWLEISKREAPFYDAFEFGGRWFLKNGPFGCIYVRPGHGCSIYERRPSVCRRYDCRVAIGLRDELSVNATVAAGVWSAELVRVARTKTRQLKFA